MDEGDKILNSMVRLFPYVIIDAPDLSFYLVTALSACAWLVECNMTIPIPLSLSLRFLAIEIWLRYDNPMVSYV